MNRLFTALTTKSTPRQKTFWFAFSMTWAAIYAFLAILPAFQGEYVIPDDARQHIFWMQRFLEPALFPEDLIADYFQSISPPGFATLYRLSAAVGIHPFFLSKIVPIFLALITTGYCFFVCIEILPIPITGFLGTLFLNQSLWIHDDLHAGASRGFLYPLFFAFLYYLLRRSLFPCLISLALLGLFYPGFILISAGMLILQMIRIENGRLQFTHKNRDYLFCGLGLIVSCGVILIYVLDSSQFGPLISVAEARTLPEFLPSGRVSVFHDENPVRYWLSASRTGIRISINPPIVILGFFLPILWFWKSSFPLLKEVKSHIIALLYLVISSLFLFFAAHILLFRLYLPSRFTVHSFRIVLAIAAAVTLTILLNAIIKAWRRQVFLTLTTIVFFTTLTVFYPHIFWSRYFPRHVYVIGHSESLYQFLQKQPQNILIASLSTEANNIPTFTQRKVLVAGEYGIAYHVGYYRQFRERLADLLQAQYSSSLNEARNLIFKYRVDFLLFDRGAFAPDYFQQNKWLKQYLSPKLPNDLIAKIIREAQNNLQQGKVPALSQVIKDCTTFETEKLTVLEAKCVVQNS